MTACIIDKLENQRTCCSWKVNLGAVGLPGADGSGIKSIDVDTTWQVTTGGSDDTGDGSAASPFASLGGALAEAQKWRIAEDATLTIKLAAGEWVIPRGASVNGVGIMVRHIDGSRIEIRGEPGTAYPTQPVKRDWATAGLGAKGWGLGGSWTAYDAEAATGTYWQNKAGNMEPSDPWTPGGQRMLQWSADAQANLTTVNAKWPTRIRVEDDCTAIYIRSDVKAINDIAIVADPKDAGGAASNFTHQWRSALTAASGYVNLNNVVAYGFPMSFWSRGYGSLKANDCAALYSSVNLAGGAAISEEGRAGFAVDPEAHGESQRCTALGCYVRGHAMFYNGWISASLTSGTIARSGAVSNVNGSKIFGNATNGCYAVDGGEVQGWGAGTEISGNGANGLYSEHGTLMLYGDVRANARFAISLHAARARVDERSVITEDNNDHVAPQVLVDNHSSMQIPRPGTGGVAAGVVISPTHEQLDPALSRGFGWVYDKNTTVAAATFQSHYSASLDIAVPEIRSGLQVWRSAEIDVVGSKPGDFVRASCTTDMQGMTLSAQVVADDKVKLTIGNTTGDAITLGTVTFKLSVWPHD